MNPTALVRTLVVDDDPFMLKLVEHLLHDETSVARVLTRTSAVEALSLLIKKEYYPDLILLDLNMPEMDGIEFIRHLVSAGYAGSLILMSGEDERILQTAQRLLQLHKLNTLGYLHKPFDRQALHALLSHWVAPVADTARPEKHTYSVEALRTAIEEGQLVNYYQPKVDMRTGKVVGAESLVRWQHPQDGLVFPDQFIGLAEANGLIDDLTACVIDAAFSQSQQWQQQGLALRLAVNLSMDNLSALAFADEIIQAAEKYAVSPSSIVLEVTESKLSANMTVALDVLSRLRLKHFHLSIDDFGTGNSSMVQLRDLPFTELKIDQGFVHGASDNATLQAIYYASLSLARELNMQVVAEGLEDKADWDLLRKTGCDLGQGYFIAKPMLAADLPAWILGWEAGVGALLN